MKTKYSIRAVVPILLVFLSLSEGLEASGHLPSSKLLLPYFEVADDNSLTTNFDVVNSGDKAVQIRVSVRSNWGLEIWELVDFHTLGPKQLLTVDLANRLASASEHAWAALGGDRSPADDKYYSSPVEGSQSYPQLAVGSVTIETLGPEHPAVLLGSYYVFDLVEDFAQGEVLTSLDQREVPGNWIGDDLCRTHLRFLGGGFDLGTEFMFWNDSAGGPSYEPWYPGVTVPARVTVYGNTGELISELVLDLEPLQKFSVSDLSLPEPFGWLEIDTTPRLTRMSLYGTTLRADSASAWGPAASPKRNHRLRVSRSSST